MAEFLTPMKQGPERRERSAQVGLSSQHTRRRTRGACKFRQCDVTGAVKALAKAGVAVASVEIAPDGKIVIATGTDLKVQSNDLDRELAEFEAQHAG